MTTTAQRLRQLPNGWLLARDLRDQPALSAARLAQHHIAAHHTWGCSSGLEVSYDDDQVLVYPGCAVDRCGRTAVLAEQTTVRRQLEQAVTVVLTAVGDGPAACVWLRDPSDVRERDIPLATVDAKGTVTSGGGVRTWLRRPGPTRILGGTVLRGAPATGTETAWATHVNLAAHGLDQTPSVVVSLAGSPPDVAVHTAGAPTPARVLTTTVDIDPIDPTGFHVLVRNHLVPVAGTAGSPSAVYTTPISLSWIAVLSAPRPEFTETEDWI